MEPFEWCHALHPFKGSSAEARGQPCELSQASAFVTGTAAAGFETTTIIITTIISPPPGVRNFGFSICALCLLRDVEKETHKHKVLWEKYFSVPQIGFGRKKQKTITFSLLKFCKL